MLAKSTVLATIAAFCVLAPAAYAEAPQPTTFDSTGAEQSYVVPSGTTAVRVTAVGAPGGAGNPAGGAPAIAGGLGAQVTGELPVTPGEALYVEVGGPGVDGAQEAGGLPGWNGGGLGGRSFGGDGSFGGGGGGASDVRLCSIGAASCAPAASSVASRLLVAGGGGGGGAAQTNGGRGGQGGNAGAVGSPGEDVNGGGGAGANQAAGGTGGFGGMCGVATEFGMNGLDGGPGAGGIGGYGVAGQDDSWGGGGGGGYYGGGGGGDGCGGGGGGGGAGSSYGPSGTTFATAARSTDTPLVMITPLAPAAQVTPASLTFAAQSLSTVSLPQIVTVTNTGNEPLTISGLTFAGAAASDFLVGSSSCGGAFAPAASCQLTVRFAPSASGPRAASLTIASNDPASPANVSLTGAGAMVAPTTGSQAAGVAPKRFGTVVLMSCRTGAHRVVRCVRRRLSANAKFVLTGTVARAKLVRRGNVYATGASNRGVLTLRSMRAVPAGSYTLTLVYSDHRTSVTVRVR